MKKCKRCDIEDVDNYLPQLCYWCMNLWMESNASKMFHAISVDNDLRRLIYQKWCNKEID